MAIQTIVLFTSHLLPTKVATTVITIGIIFIICVGGGYIIHPNSLPDYLKWTEIVSSEKWLMPLLTESEYSVETIASTSVQQLCRNKQVCSRKI